VDRDLARQIRKSESPSVLLDDDGLAGV